MATITYYMSPITLLIQFLNNVGVVLNGGFVNVYVAGSVSTPVTTYTDSTGTVPNANPIALSAAGRLVAAGTGAPVAVWVPANTPHKMVVTDSTGAFICSIDNLLGLNDLSSVLTSLATPSTSSVPGGVDLVANAVKSYFNFAAIRAAPVPTLVAGQTVIVIASGQTTENDTRGGPFIYDASSTVADDNFNVLAPAGVTGTNPGRYLRIREPYLPDFDPTNPVTQGGATAGTFTGQLTGFTAAAPVTCTYYQLGLAGQGSLVFLTISAFTGTSNATTMTLTGLPTAIIPASGNPTQTVTVGDSSTNFTGNLQINGGQSVIQFGKTAGAVGGFTASGTKGIPVSITVMYQQS